MRTWIMDEENTPQRFPLRRLIEIARQEASYTAPVCIATRARGYGASIRNMEIALEDVDSIEVDLREVEGLAEGTREWFYDLDLEFPSRGLRLGLHDSTALYIESDDATLCTSIAANFQNTRNASP